MRYCSNQLETTSAGVFIAVWLVALAILGAPTNAAGGPASQPVPRSDTNSMIAHEQLLEKASRGRIDVYFVGDSITRRWGATDPQYRDLFNNWQTNFFGWNAANFGWGGDKIENIIWRMEHGELEGVNPRVIVVLAGINNIGSQPVSPEKIEDIAQGLKRLVEICQAKAPSAAIILTAIFPRNDNLAVVPAIEEINARMAHWVDGRRVRFLDINHQLADDAGKLLPGMVNSDQLHPTLKAYQIWADALKPIFSELLGPPTPTDHAPPPTGDPSLARKQ